MTTTTVDASLQSRLDDIESILTSGDADRLGDLYTEDATLMPPGSEMVSGRDDVASFWMGLSDVGVARVDIDTVEVEIDDETANRVGVATLYDADGGDVDDVKFVEVWTREGGDWRIHRDIWNTNRSDEA